MPSGMNILSLFIYLFGGFKKKKTQKAEPIPPCTILCLLTYMYIHLTNKQMM